MLVVYIVTGMAFMLLPGTFVGVVNLLRISATHTPAGAGAGWVQAHGHAQIFGWLGTFILGIGYYAIPRLRLSAFSRCAAWTTYASWVAGVTARWAIGTWPGTYWRIIFPAAALLELTAVLIFAASVYLARPRSVDNTWRKSVVLISGAGVAMVAAMILNAFEAIRVALHDAAPVFPAAFNQRYLVVITWGFIVPFIWGFSSRWIPPLLGLRKTRKELLVPALLVLFAGVATANGWILFAASALYIFAMRLFEPSQNPPKLRGVHESTPAFLRLAYFWSLVAAALAIVAAKLPEGYGGGSRHALTVGFFTAAVFTIGPRVLPAFFVVRRLWSTRLMAAALALLNIGCTTRVVAQIVAYQHLSERAWPFLTLSAVIEMTAVTLFAINMMMTLTTGSPVPQELSDASRSDRPLRCPLEGSALRGAL